MENDMYLIKTDKTIALANYSHIVSIGNKCATTILLRNLNLYKESYPFDYVPTQPHLILKYIKDFTTFLPKQNNVRNIDEVWFGHYNVKENYEQTVQKFQRKIKRLYDALEKPNKILLVYSTEADVYNEMNSRYNDNYQSLIDLNEHLKLTFPATCNIAAIHTNKTFEDTADIINFTINVGDNHLSNNMETHVPKTYNLYRNTLKEVFKAIFK